MGRQELLARVSAMTGRTRDDCATVLDALIDTVVDEVGSGRSVKLRGFGVFSAKKLPARQGVGPDGRAYNRSERYRLVFKPSENTDFDISGV